MCVLQTHSNDTIGSIRWKISEHLSCPVDNVQIFANDSVVGLLFCLSPNDFYSFIAPFEFSFFTFTLKAFAPFYTLLIKGFPLQHSCVSPAARGQMIHSNLILERCRSKHETQLLHNFDPIPVVLVVCLCFLLFFSSDLIPSLLPHRALADHESRPEAALPAGLQRRAESHGEELGYRHSLRQL